jgi:ribulose-phosphate 3-epimerase
MGVTPGFADQKLIPNGLEKIARVREILDRADPHIELVIDGNTTIDNARKMLAAGADSLVTGTSSMLKEGPEKFGECYRNYIKSVVE